jgi:hypothetical protein
MAVQAQSAHAIAAIKADLMNHDLLPLLAMEDATVGPLARRVLIEAGGARSGRKVESPEPWERTLRRLPAAVKNEA